MCIVKPFHLLLVLAYVFISESRFDAFFTKLECKNHLPNILYNISCLVNQSVKGTPSLNAEFILREDIHNLSSSFFFEVQRGKVLRNYTEMQIDFCAALGMLHNNILFKLIWDEMRRSSNLPVKCPLRKDTLYYLKEYTIDPTYIPIYTPDLNFTADTTFYVNKRKLLRWINYGQVVRKRGRNKP